MDPSGGQLGLILSHCILYGDIHGPFKIHERHIQDMCDMDPTDSHVFEVLE